MCVRNTQKGVGFRKRYLSEVCNPRNPAKRKKALFLLLFFLLPVRRTEKLPSPDMTLFSAENVWCLGTFRHSFCIFITRNLPFLRPPNGVLMCCVFIPKRQTTRFCSLPQNDWNAMRDYDFSSCTYRPEKQQIHRTRCIIFG